MKFTSTLQFNCVPDWAEHYISYSNLKKLIYQIEKELQSVPIVPEDIEAVEVSPLLDSKSRTNSIFIPALDKELAKISIFYISKEKELFDEVTSLVHDYAVFENLNDSLSVHSNSLVAGLSYQSSESAFSQGRSSHFIRRSRSASDAAASHVSSDDDENYNYSTVNLLEGRLPYMWGPPSIEERRIHLKKRTVELFVWLSELKSYSSLNKTGFSKILKKYDKVTSSNLKDSYLSNVVNDAYPFKASAIKNLEDHIFKVQEIYSYLCTNADMDIAIRELKTHLREFIVWERNTIWRDIISLERKSHAVGVKAPVAVEQLGETPANIQTPFGMVIVPKTFWRSFMLLLVCIAVFLFFLNANFFKKEEQNNCFALLILASLLWSLEVIPLFVTSLLVPLMVVCLRVLRTDESPHRRLDAHETTKLIFSTMFSPVIMLLLGGFAIAGALSKYHIAKMMATIVLSKAGTKPSYVLLSNMFVATFASMWISNVAAPVLCLSLIQPILRSLPPDSSFGRCLILGIALASNIGGMASPISSPQNIIAIQNMDPSPTWAQWFLIAIPLCIIVDILIWFLLLWNYQPHSDSLTIHPIRSTRDPWTGTQIFVIVVTILTIILWCIEKQMESFFGDMGVIAVIPLVLFFGTGILTKEDFNNFLWTVIILAMGGIALGSAVHDSGLLHVIAKTFQLMTSDLDVWQVFVVFAFLVLVVATFISHTVGALIILPIVAEIGDKLGGSHRNLLVMGSALMCSVAMGLPISGFPNMNAIMMEDEMGLRYLNIMDFVKSGIPGSLLGMLAIVTIGYGLMLLIGF
ncbi:SPX domain-containing protein [Gigaspora rosea]|uniref:SPX domain-containing protein n=1 Tax=Gigaspora rosea TaxID=44941 RepID=A0A397UNJ0_9GLOM|nr:SPX domain-containing protein [Gigaspora rosea]